MTAPLPLPSVTLVIIDTANHDLARLALWDTLQQITPAETQFWTDDPVATNIECSFFKIPKITSISDYNNVLWYEVPKHITTSHILIIQWDGWVINSATWTDEFLHYDYIGAVWPWHKSQRIGNGGFSLRSKKLMDWLHTRNFSPGQLEDDFLCRSLRPTLETFGYKWAPEFLANRFSCEHNWTTPVGFASWPLSDLPFGFHDCRNWPRVLSPDQLHFRMTLCDLNPHTSQKKEYQELRQWV